MKLIKEGVTMEGWLLRWVFGGVGDVWVWSWRSLSERIYPTIKVYELLGAEVYLYFDLDEFPHDRKSRSRTTARPGDTVKFALDVEKIHVFDKETRAGYYQLVLSFIRDFKVLVCECRQGFLCILLCTG